MKISLSRGLIGLSPIILFLLLYVGVSLAIGDFYKMPFCVALLVASIWGVIITRGKLRQRIETYTSAAAHNDIIYMIWIFILAGAFASVAGEIGAVNATVAITLKYLPASLIVPGLFLAACFISLAVGTSVGTVVALTPLAVEIAEASGASVPFMVAVVLGGAFFGDNLSFISDTTIAATRSQGCDMADKFRANIRIAAPAAIITLILYFFLGEEVSTVGIKEAEGPWWLVIPYLIVIVAAILRLNVNIVLTLGLFSAFIAGIIRGHGILDLCSFMGTGIDSMGDLIIITLMASGLLGLVKAAGGIDWLLQALSSRIRGSRGGQATIVLLVGLVNLCTANNTVAIITVGGISRDIANRYRIPARRSASLLDTGSCIVQCLIPYGAQTLLATSLAAIPPSAPFPYLYYPWTLAAIVIIAIFCSKNRPT